MKDVRSHLGLRISNFAPKKPSNVRMIAKEYSRVKGFASSLEHQSRVSARTALHPVRSTRLEGAGKAVPSEKSAKARDERRLVARDRCIVSRLFTEVKCFVIFNTLIVAGRPGYKKVRIANSQVNRL
jgi:hypothetical protein